MSEKKWPSCSYADLTISLSFELGGWSIEDVNRLIEKIVRVIEQAEASTIQHIGIGVGEE